MRGKKEGNPHLGSPHLNSEKNVFGENQKDDFYRNVAVLTIETTARIRHVGDSLARMGGHTKTICLLVRCGSFDTTEFERKCTGKPRPDRGKPECQLSLHTPTK